MWPRFMSNLFSKDSMRSFLDARFALWKEDKVNLWIRRKDGQVTLCIAAVQGEKALVLDIPPRPAKLKFTP